MAESTDKGAKKPAGAKPVFDVSKPGKTPANATSRPVIIGHGPMVKDDAVKSDKTNTPTTDTPEKETLATAAPRGKKITPPQETSATIEDDSKATNDAATEKDEEPVPSTEEALDDKSEPEAETPQSDESAEIEAVTEQAEASKAAKETDEEKAKRETLEQHIKDKTYYLPIKQSGGKRSGRFLLFASLVALLLLVAGYLLIDAGFVQTSMKLPVDFIHNKTTTTDATAATSQPAQPELQTAKVCGVSAKYPDTWKSVSEPKTCALTIDVKNSQNLTDFPSVIFLRDVPSPVSNTTSPTITTSTTVSEMTCSGTNVNSSGNIYMCQVIAKSVRTTTKDSSTVYLVRAYLTNDKTVLSEGAPFTLDSSSIVSADGKHKDKFTLIVFNITAGSRPGFDSLESAKAYTQNQYYKQGINILKSLRYSQ